MKIKSKMSELWALANQITGEIEHWILTHDKKRVRLRFKPLDMARLSKFKVWEYRYKLSTEEILDLILTPLRNQMTYRKKGYGLGVSVKTLVGNKALQILEDQIKRYYGDGQIRTIWREREREKQLLAEAQDNQDGVITRKSSAPPSLLEAESINGFIQAYEKSVTSQREQLRQASTQSWRKRKHYRGSPWL